MMVGILLLAGALLLLGGAATAASPVRVGVTGTTIPRTGTNTELPAHVFEQAATVQRAHVWMTVGGTRPYVKSLQDLKQDKWAPGKPVFDEYKGPDAVQGGVPPARVPPCAGTLGHWCASWWASKAEPTRQASRGSKPCPGQGPGGCNGVGVCNHDIGVCMCPAGWTGDGCELPHRRPCTNRHSSPTDTPGIPASYIDPVTLQDLNLTTPGWTASRCAGVCDDNIGACYCGYGSTYGRVLPPPGSPPGTPPVKLGRPLHDGCKPTTDAKGTKHEWGVVTWDKLYGPNGWCQAADPELKCACPDGRGGLHCDKPQEMICPNQCNGRGVCQSGFCKCHQGWYGTACDRKRAGEPVEADEGPRLKDLPVPRRSWREAFQRNDDTPRPPRKRPLIFVYDLPPDFNTGILQLRVVRDSCWWRIFSHDNFTAQTETGYTFESYFHDTLLSSPYRTLDPEEADFFYLPIYLTCFIWPVLGWADGPWYYAPTVHPRTMHLTNMMLEAKRWVQRHYPYWNRTEGRDHIFVTAHDEGACYTPHEIYNTAIMFTHWGRLEEDHVSGTAWPADNYSMPMTKYPKHQPGDWRDTYRGHPCYTPGKDLLVPAMRRVDTWHASPLQGTPPYKRDILFFFRADVGLWREWWYSRGIRQTLYRLAMEDEWRAKYGIVIGTRSQYDGDYSVYLARSKFCLVAMGDGWSARSEDAILHGCVPVIINDDVEPVLHGVVDWEQFSIRVPQARMHELPSILMQVTEEKLLRMQQALAQAWTRFVYVTGPYLQPATQQAYDGRMRMRNDTLLHPMHPFRPLHRFPPRRDAFHTIMQWLHSRIPAEKQRQRHRGGGAGGGGGGGQGGAGGAAAPGSVFDDGRDLE